MTNNRPTTERQLKLLAESEECNVFERMLDGIDSLQHERTHFGVIRTEHRGLSVITLEDIPPNTVILRYHGELICGSEGTKREAQQSAIDKFVYFKHADKRYCVDSQNVDPRPLRGTLGRLVNHARGTAENCELNRHQRQDGRLCLYFETIKHVTAYCNLYWDYGERRPIAIEASPWLENDVPENEWFVNVRDLVPRRDPVANVMVFDQPSLPFSAPGISNAGPPRRAAGGRSKKTKANGTVPPAPGVSANGTEPPAPGVGAEASDLSSVKFDAPRMPPLEPTDTTHLLFAKKPESYEELLECIGQQFDVCDLPTRLAEVGVLREVGISKEGNTICYFAFEAINWDVWFELNAVRYHSGLSASTSPEHRAIMRRVTTVCAVEVDGYFYEVLMNDWCTGNLFCRLHQPGQPTFQPDQTVDIFRAKDTAVVIPYPSVKTHAFQPFLWENPKQQLCRLPDAQTLAGCTLHRFLPPQKGLYQAPYLRPKSVYRSQDKHERNLRSKQGGPAVAYVEDPLEDEIEGDDDDDQPLSAFSNSDSKANITADGHDPTTSNDSGAPEPELGIVYTSEEALIQMNKAAAAHNEECKKTLAEAKKTLPGAGRATKSAKDNKPARKEFEMGATGAIQNPTGAPPKPLKRVKAPSAIFGDDAILETAEQLDNRVTDVASTAVYNRLSNIQRQLETAYVSYANRLTEHAATKFVQPHDLDSIRAELVSLRTDFGGLQDAVKLLVVDVGTLSTTMLDQFANLTQLIIGNREGVPSVTTLVLDNRALLCQLNDNTPRNRSASASSSQELSAARRQKRASVTSPKHPEAVAGRGRESPEHKQRRRSESAVPPHDSTRSVDSPIVVKTNPRVCRPKTSQPICVREQPAVENERRRSLSVGPIAVESIPAERPRPSGGGTKRFVGGLYPAPAARAHKPTVISVGGVTAYGGGVEGGSNVPKFAAPNNHTFRAPQAPAFDPRRQFGGQPRGQFGAQPGVQFGAQPGGQFGAQPGARPFVSHMPHQNGARAVVTQPGQMNDGAHNFGGAQQFRQQDGPGETRAQGSGVNVVNSHYSVTSAAQNVSHVNPPANQYISGGQQQIISPNQNQHPDFQVNNAAGGNMVLGQGVQVHPASVTVGNTIHQQHSYLNVMQQKSPIVRRVIIDDEFDDDPQVTARDNGFASTSTAGDDDGDDDVFEDDDFESDVWEDEMSRNSDSDGPPYSPLGDRGSTTNRSIDPSDTHNLSAASDDLPLSELQIMLDRDLAFGSEVTIGDDDQSGDRELEFTEDCEQFLNRRFEEGFVNEYHVAYTFEEFKHIDANIDDILANVPEITVKAFRKEAAKATRKFKEQADRRTMEAMGVFLRELTQYVLLGRLISPRNYRKLKARYRAHYVLPRGILATKLQLLHWLHVKRLENAEKSYKKQPAAIIIRQHPVFRRLLEYSMRLYMVDENLWKGLPGLVVWGLNKALKRTQEMIDNRQKHVRKFLKAEQREVWTREGHNLRLEVRASLDRDENGCDTIIDWNPYDEIMFLDFPGE